MLLLAGCALSLDGYSNNKGEDSSTSPSKPTGPPALAQASLRALLAPARYQPEATYQQLGLRYGQAVHVFYAEHDFTARWIQEAGWNQEAVRALALLGRAAEVGLPRSRYAWDQLLTLPDSLRLAPSAKLRNQQLARFELRLTDALLRYSSHLRQGYLQPHSLTPAVQPDSLVARQAANALHEALLTPDFEAMLLRAQPASRRYRLLQTSWTKALRTSPTDSARLMQDTVAGFRQVALNLERLRWEAPTDSEYIIVNIPAYRLQVMRHEQVVQTHKVIVGEPEWPTPLVSSRLLVFVTAPEWRVPYSIAVREFLPELQRDPSYLYDNHYRLYDGRNRLINPWRVNWQKITPEKFSYAIRQRAGSFNALGNVVFYFPNEHSVFLHDTPARTAFTRADRALSHGCVRVENPVKLAEYLLRREGRLPDLATMHASIRNREKHRFDLQRPLRIYLRYYTCETDNGRLNFLPDIYHLDAPLAAALFEQ
ncbi:L,D-transpeptidase family protein [Hymenobacter tenuis]